MNFHGKQLFAKFQACELRRWVRVAIILGLVSVLLLPHIGDVTQTGVMQTSKQLVRRDSYILVGGQNGTWFQPGQDPRLLKIFLQNNSVTQLTPVPGQGTVWGGGYNGTQWLISGWGRDSGTSGSNPYLYFYNGQSEIENDSLDQYVPESSWHGGDIFSASYNGTYWLLSGMGSNNLITPTYQAIDQNHMSLAFFDGNDFIDLSNIIPRQQDAILYANAWNGRDWLVGGGFLESGVLFTFNGTSVVDLTSSISESVPEFGSVQSIGWNGEYWLIGGIGFLAMYDGYKFIDLTDQLAQKMDRETLTVNAIAWDGSSWMIAGGSPIAQTDPDVAWIATYGSTGFSDLSTALPSYISHPALESSILTICWSNDAWILGGYSDGNGVLLSIRHGVITDLSSLVSPTMSYVNWVSSSNS